MLARQGALESMPAGEREAENRYNPGSGVLAVHIDPVGPDEAHPAAIEGEGTEVRLFTAAILAGDHVAARRLVQAPLGSGLGHVYERIVAPAMAEVGRRWYENRITVAEQHLATAVAQAAVASLYPLIRWPPGGPRAVVGCVEPELHTFGARMVADLLALDGWRTTFAGGRGSLARGLDGAGWGDVKLVAVSITLGAHVPAARALMQRVRERAPGAKILVGGRAVLDLPDASRLLGVDAAAASASQAVRVARAWR
ncbi:cobalamin B12-binding domain-containing protein [Sorangium sp. So ce1097]|uniref:cobalamin B12-binding domain-containing protein n=1 Tax=Sorangium sp. So ce1097 TaxID=3133330 RepID=UPI003F606495